MSSSVIDQAMERQIGPTAEGTRTVEVPCRNGIHLRVAGVIVYFARQFRSDISFTSGQLRVDAKSILGLLGLSAIQGQPLEVTARGEDAERAVQVFADLFESKELLCRGEDEGGTR